MKFPFSISKKDHPYVTSMADTFFLEDILVSKDKRERERVLGANFIGKNIVNDLLVYFYAVLTL